MKVKLVILSLLISISILISACSSTQTGQKLSMGEINELYPCIDVSCDKNEACVEGECVCDADSKTCPGEDTCIPKTDCCSDNECGSGETCISNKCVFSCNNLQAESNKVCDPAKKALVCMPGYAWCENQNKCIPMDHCCSTFECSRGKDCVPTLSAAEVCLENSIKNCKFINQGEERALETGDTKAVVKILDIFYDKKVTMLIDGKETVLTRGGRYAAGPGKMIFLASIKEYGGSCRES